MNGGFDAKPVKNSDFKYTKNKSRKEWVKNIYPFGEHLIPLFSKIPWNKYSYKGPLRVWYSLDDDNIEYSDIEITANYTSSLPPFYYFGGTSYELLNATYPYINLHKYVDPTGDIDMILNIPHISYKDEEYDYIKYFFQEKTAKTLTLFIDHFTKWVFEEVCNQFENMPKYLFNEIFNNCESNDTDENKNRRIIKDKIIITHLFEDSSKTIKIQGSCKFKNTKEDHFFEFLLPLNDLEDMEFLNSSKKNILKLKNNLYISDLKNLFIGDMIAIQTRIHAFTSEDEKDLEHKFYNHIGRFEYLISFIRKCVLKDNILKLSNSEITNLIQYSLKIFVLFYLLKHNNKLKLIDYTNKLSNKEIINKYIKKYYDTIKENNKLSEYQSALSLENKSFKKSQIDGLNISIKKGDTKEPTITYKDIYNELFSSSGGYRETRKIKNVLVR